MSLFGKIVKTAINVGIGLPVAIVKDVVTMGNVGSNSGPYTPRQLEKIKEEADE